jgi:hypothetical protein
MRAPGPQTRRRSIELGAIALRGNWSKPALDPPSAAWLRLSSNHDRVRGSGLWNIRHVDQTFDPTFLTALEECVATIRVAISAGLSYKRGGHEPRRRVPHGTPTPTDRSEGSATGVTRPNHPPPTDPTTAVISPQRPYGFVHPRRCTLFSLQARENNSHRRLRSPV